MNHLFYFLSCCSFVKTKEQFKQIVLSTEFEFNWAKLSWKLTEIENGWRERRTKGETGLAREKLLKFIYCISEILRRWYFEEMFVPEYF